MLDFEFTDKLTMDFENPRPDIIKLLQTAQTLPEHKQRAALKVSFFMLRLMTDEKPAADTLKDLTAAQAFGYWDTWHNLTALDIMNPKRFNAEFIRREYVGSMEELLQTKSGATLVLMFNAFIGGLDMAAEFLRIDSAKKHNSNSNNTDNLN